MRVKTDVVKPAENGVEMHFLEIFCDSSEVADLPTAGVYEGSSAFTTDTGEVYFFNEKSSSWNKL